MMEKSKAGKDSSSGRSGSDCQVISDRKSERPLASEERIRTENMAVGYGEKTLIRQIRLHVNSGQIVTLIGPNGAGKSTILKSIIGQLPLKEGAVYLDGSPVSHMKETEIAKCMSVMMTEGAKPELMTCRQVASLGRYPYTGRLGILSPQDHRKVEEALELVGALELGEQYFSQVSDGQKQRILLARAICQEPDVIVLDEPTSFLDIRHKLELLSLLKGLARKQKLAVLMSLHELDLAQKLSDCIVCVKGDRIDRWGPPERVITSEYIRDLYGISRGNYDPRFGSLEMEGTHGHPRVFVIGGNGTGIPVYRRLHRQGIPFAAGILHENDIDYPVASALAGEVAAERPFEPITEETYEKAAQVMDACEQVICCLEEFGTMNQKNRELALRAEKKGILLREEAD